MPKIVIGNKTDLGNNRRQVSFEKAAKWCEKHDAEYFETRCNESEWIYK